MAKFPAAPAPALLASIAPRWRTFPSGKYFSRVYFTGGLHPVAWNTFRTFGPTSARFDHHRLNAQGKPHHQNRATIYLADNPLTCLAEVFQDTRVINTTVDDPFLVVFCLAADLTVLDLTGNFVTALGASTAIHSGQRARARQWAQALYTAYPTMQGIAYCSSMNGNATALVINERALASGAIPKSPLHNRALNDRALGNLIPSSAATLGYGVI